MLKKENAKTYVLWSLIAIIVVAFGFVLHIFDWDILFFIQDHIKNGVLDIIVPFYTTLGEDGIIWIVAGVIMLIPKKTRKCGIMVLAALLVMLVVNNLTLKKIFERPRPCVEYPWMVTLVDLPKLTSYSFPSGHTTSAFSVAFTIYSQHKKLGIIAIIMAAFMAFTRLYVFVHFPTDIYAGICVGACIAYFIYRMEKIVTPKVISLIHKKA